MCIGPIIFGDFINWQEIAGRILGNATYEVRSMCGVLFRSHLLDSPHIQASPFKCAMNCCHRHSQKVVSFQAASVFIQEQGWLVMCKVNQILSVSQQDLPRSPMSDSISLCNGSNASELSLNMIEGLLREANDVQNFRDRVTTMSFQPQCSQLEISVCRSSSLDWKKDQNRTEPNCKRPDHRLRLHKF